MTNHPRYSPPPQQPGYRGAPNQPGAPAYAQGHGQQYNQPRLALSTAAVTDQQYRSYEPFASRIGFDTRRTGPGRYPAAPAPVRYRRHGVDRFPHWDRAVPKSVPAQARWPSARWRSRWCRPVSAVRRRRWSSSGTLSAGRQTAAAARGRDARRSGRERAGRHRRAGRRQGGAQRRHARDRSRSCSPRRAPASSCRPTG